MAKGQGTKPGHGKDWCERRFPSTFARNIADEAIDALPNSEPMAAFIDTWLAAYKAAGGRDGKPWEKK